MNKQSIYYAPSTSTNDKKKVQGKIQQLSKKNAGLKINKTQRNTGNKE